MTPTARSLVHLRRLGFLAATVEIWIPRVNRKRDLFGIGDVLAVHPRDKAVLLVQATTADHVADRLKRVRRRPELPALLRAGVAVEVWGWCQRGSRWYVRREALRPEDLTITVQALPRHRRGKRASERGLFDGILAPGSTQRGADNP
jgi:hypothetical protein